MEKARIADTGLEVSRVTLGAWAIGGWMWGGTDEAASIRTIHTAIDHGVNCVDTAPIYGSGRSEEIVGKALRELGGRGDEVLISTKAGLEFPRSEGDAPRRNATKERLEKEIDDSLRRLGVDHVDIYFVHWPDPLVPFEETAEAMATLREKGKIRAIGVSNFSPAQMDRFRRVAPIHVAQPPFNLFERGIEDDVLPYCKENDIALMTYGALCRGLLSGKMTRDREFAGDDLRQNDPKFQQPQFDRYLAAVDRLDALARDRYDRAVLPLAVRWVLDRGVDVALWGGRRPDQMAPIDDVTGWHIDGEGNQEIEAILKEYVPHPIGPEFMAPPDRSAG